jgi:Na+/H+ antiporter NhaD/arsenite permease-like protein
MDSFGHSVPPYWLVPFGLMLGGIAILPLVAGHWWEHNRNRALFAAVLALPVAAYLWREYPHGLLHSVEEYASFIALLGSLYVIAGGIHVSGDLAATPRNNTAILGLGAVLANLVGTTGASMLLIRVLLKTNSERRHIAHTPFFFILIVSNCGGLLTPLGDPPLFLGYLRGVPFTWTFGLYPYWLLANGYLLTLYYFIDRRAYRREDPQDLVRDERNLEPVRVDGLINVPLLFGVIGAIFMPTPYRELVMLALGAVSIFLAPKEPRARNNFSYGPILEVAILFAGIFVTMVPALAVLEVRGGELGLTRPWEFFLITGVLSSVLDNAPTYLTFLSTLQGMSLPAEVVGIPAVYLTAISVGAVFMGANTYIGNGPNFMVKAIAEEAGVAMPSFFGYAARAILVLTPVYLIVIAALTNAP